LWHVHECERGQVNDELLVGAVRSTIDDLGKATLAADKAIVF